MRGFVGLGFGTWVVSALAVCVACGGNASSEASGGVSSGGAAGSRASGGQGASSGVSSGGTKPTSGGTMPISGGTTGTGDVTPQSAVAGASVMGSGPCKGHTLGELAMTVHANYPGLSDIQEFYDPK